MKKEKSPGAMKKFIKKMAIAVLTGAIAFSVVPATVQAAGWKQNKNGYWWQENDYSYPKNQWKTIYGKQYHFNSKGYMDIDWTKVDGKWYYFGGKNDGAKKTYWQQVRGKYYWLGSNGVMRTGWQNVYGKYYWLGGSNDGAMKTGWQKVGGKYYLLGKNGDMKSGWQTVYGKKYYLGSANDGSMKTGWQKIGGSDYYFGRTGEPNEGVLRTSTWVGNYYVDSSGRWDKYKSVDISDYLSVSNNEPGFQVETATSEEEYQGPEQEPYNPMKDLENYRFPTIDLMKHFENDDPTIDMDEQNANKDRIINTLRSFGIEISTIKATVGPTVTLYEITPEQGVRISKIRGLEDDIALSLSADGIRIIAPIPGKGTIGIEVPNKNPKIVSGQSVIGSKKFQESKFDLPIVLGKTITNEVFMFDLCKMPHVLVAGATGQGKSVGLNAIITSLLYKKHPAELKFVLVDPKKVEFSIYSVIENHFLAKLPDGGEPIITDVTKVVQTLNSVCVEMDTRYDLLKMAHVRNVKEYNEKFINRRLNPEKGHKFMPYIVVVIDEFGDLIMTAGKEVELPIARIAQLARAVGIHMIIATQRPTTNIITGTIKANFPARIAFRVSAMMDSRTILDRPGANRLIGKGDMLFLQGADPVRVQCAFIDTPEVEEITKFIARQQSYPTPFFLPEYVSEDSGSEVGDIDMGRLDPLFEDAARLVVIHQQGSTSLIQRKFAIGYNRAGRIMDQLEKAGIVGPTQGSKARDVLCIDDNDLEMRLNNLQ